MSVLSAVFGILGFLLEMPILAGMAIGFAISWFGAACVLGGETTDRIIKEATEK